VQTVKPLIDRSFRTLPEREHTGIMGSSMGGLVSLYGFFRFCDWFGFAGVMSPSLWFAGGAIFPYVLQARGCPGSIYLDMGGRESAVGKFGLNYGLRNTRRMQRLLMSKGYSLGRHLHYVEDLEAEHTEGAWAHRLPDALRFLLQQQPVRQMAFMQYSAA
jgi:predicted alpha/beta superfamily hydrolase